jgi:outer membrane protein W
MKKIILLIALFNTVYFTQNKTEKFNLFVGADYITTAQIFLNPNSSDLILRNESFELTDLYSPVVDLRYFISEEMLIGLSTEYISKKAYGYNETAVEGSQLRQIEVEDGVTYIPLELSVYYLMPFSTDDFYFTMGGGVGYYFGSHSRKLGDAEIENIEKNNSIGLLVSIGIEYKIYNQIGFRFDMKFRDPENKITSKYDSETTIYRDRQLQIPQNEFDTKINLNGISFLLGATFHF